MNSAKLSFIVAFMLLPLVAVPFLVPPPASSPVEDDSSQDGTISKPLLFNTPEADRVLSHLSVFPEDNPWNADISSWPLHTDSAKMVASVGLDKPLRYNLDMAFILVPPDQKRVPLKLTGYADESDPGPFPIPDEMPIEDWPLNGIDLHKYQRQGEGDRHALVVDPTNRKLYELYQARRTDSGWEAAQSSVFDLASNKLRPEGWTSTDAAGLPIFPAVVRYDEVARGQIKHALRVTIRKSRRAFVYPARHYASKLTDPSLPRMGERFRLRQDFDVSGYSSHVRAILKALQKHGMFVADNGLEWCISVAPDKRIVGLSELRRLKGKDFEVVRDPNRP